MIKWWLTNESLWLIMCVMTDYRFVWPSILWSKNAKHMWTVRCVHVCVFQNVECRRMRRVDAGLMIAKWLKSSISSDEPSNQRLHQKPLVLSLNEGHLSISEECMPAPGHAQGYWYFFETEYASNSWLLVKISACLQYASPMSTTISRILNQDQPRTSKALDPGCVRG